MLATASCARRSFALLALLLLTALPARAQVASPEAVAQAAEQAESRPPVAAEALRSPRATMGTFLEAMNALWADPGAWDRAMACLDLSKAPRGEGRARARAVYAALNHIELVDVSRLPGAEQAAGLARYRFFPDPHRHRALLRELGPPAGGIALARGDDGLWRFDADTVAEAPQLAQQLAALPRVAGPEILSLADWIEARLPESVASSRFLGVKSWTWVVIFAVILLGLVADLLLRAVLRVATRRLASRLGGREDPAELRRALRPMGQAAAVLVWLLPIGLLDLEPTIERVLGGALRILLVLFGTLSAWRLVDLAAGLLATRAQRTATRVDDILVPLISRGVKLFVLTMGLVYGAEALDVPITPLIASLTVAGVGFSFAAKDTVENFFGSVAVVLDRPFDIGDWVVVGDTEGTVEQVGFRSTRIRTFYNSLVTVPNANLVRATVDNYGRRRYRRWKTTLALEYGTPPARLVAFTEGVRELVRSHPYTRKDYYQVWCNEFGASSLDVLLYVFFEVPDWDTELRERERLFLDILRLADRLGVSFAFPTQTLHVFPGEAPGEPAEPPGADDDEAAARSGAREAQRIIEAQPWRRQRPGPARPVPGPTASASGDGGPSGPAPA